MLEQVRMYVCTVHVYRRNIIIVCMVVHTCVFKLVHTLRAKTKITGGHWSFSVHISKMANQNIKQDTFKCANGQSNS